MNQLKEAARLFYNLTMADTTVIIRPPNAQKQAAIVAAGQALVAALALPDAEPAGEVRAKSDAYGGTFVLWKQLPVAGMFLYTHAQPAIAPEPVNSLQSIADQLRQAGATLPVATKGTIESAMQTGLSIALAIVENVIQEKQRSKL